MPSPETQSVLQLLTSCLFGEVANQVFTVGRHRAGHVVDVRVHPTFLEVWDGPELVKTVMRTSKGVVRKKKAEKH